MTMRRRTPTEPFATALNDKSSRALVYDVPASEVPRGRVMTSVARSSGDAIRRKLRAIASESGPGKWLNKAKLLRPLLAQAHDILRERFEQAAQLKIICAIGRNLPTARWSVCSTLHRYLTGYVIGAWSLRLQRLRW
jgi:hypothetical protein